MRDRNRPLLLIAIMAVVCIATVGTTSHVLYRAALEEQKTRMMDLVRVQARLIERFLGSEPVTGPGTGRTANLSSLIDVYRDFPGFGRTGALTVGERRGDQVVFIVHHRQAAQDVPHPSVPWVSSKPNPMRSALQGHSGWMIGVDYRDVEVLAVFEPIRDIDLGLVVKIDLAEIQKPFIEASLVALGITTFMVLLGSLVFRSLTQPMIRHLENSERKYRSLFEQASLAILVIDGDRKIVDANEQASVLAGVHGSALHSRPVDDVYGPEFWPAVPPEFPVEMAGRVHRVDGSVRHIEINARHIGDGMWQALARDVSDRKTNELELERMRSRFVEAERIGETGWFELSLTTLDFQVSDTFSARYGYRVDKPFKLSEVLRMVCPADLTGFLKVCRGAIASRKRLYYDLRVRFEAELRCLHIEAEVRTDDNHEPVAVVGVVHDITDRRSREQMLRSKEAQLAQSQRLESMGRLAGGIAHDFNNILASVSGYANLLIGDLANQPEQRSFAQRIVTAADRGKEVIEQILVFARAGKMDRQTLEVRHLVQETFDLLKTSISLSAEIRSPKTCGPIYVHVNAGQFHQVLMNLCLNANGAAGGRPGKLLIDLDVQCGPAEFETSTEGIVSQGKLEPERRYLCMSVADNGHGMDSETLHRCMEPFFTTREPGKGTGLGLSVVLGIVAAYEGGIKIESHVGVGTTVSIYLPLVSPLPDADTPGEARPPGRRGEERILLVDDNTDVLTVTRIALERAGHRVTAFADPRLALTAFQHSPGNFDVVISDQVMPGMDGVRFLSLVKKLRPSISAVLCTGFSGDITAQSAKANNIDLLISKPISPIQLLQQIRSAIQDGADQVATST